MTREEAITVLKAFMENPLFSEVHKAAFNIAIHDIRQRHDWDINKLMLVPKPEWEQEPKKGYWIENAPEYQNIDPPYICSECGNMHLRKTNYCDQCGADMREVKE